MVEPVEKAAVLGREHGETAARAWAKKYGPHSIGRIKASDYLNGRTRTPSDWPLPEVHKLDDWTLTKVEWINWARTYEAAYTAAVEATIKEMTT